MNAPTPAAAVAPTFAMHMLATFATSTTRTQARRRARFSQQELEELAANIKAIGAVIQPIVARPHPNPSAPIKFEIVAGERRWIAAGMAGMIEIPAIVRDVSDADLITLQLTENLQRKTLGPLEEAEGYDELRQERKISADQVADLLGISRRTVFNRLKLLELCPEAIAALNAGKLPASNATLIAAIPHHDTQRKALKASEGDQWDGPLSYNDLRAYIADKCMVALKGAPFKLDDETLLKKAGSCAACPKRTGNQRDQIVEVKNPNVCTDPKCFGDKRAAIFARQAAELEAKGQKVIAGPAARKLMPYDNDHVAGGYTKMSEYQYGHGCNGRTAAQILGPDFKPTVIQHPSTGELIKVASIQAIAAALRGKKPKSESSPRKPKAPRIDLPDLDDQVEERLISLIVDKAPKVYSRAFLLKTAKLLIPETRARDDKLEKIAKQFGLPKRAFSSNYIGNRLPAEAEKFDEAKLLLLLCLVAFAAYYGPCGGRAHILAEFGLEKENKIRDQIIAERKKAQADARAKAKLQKASPLKKGKK